MPGVPSNKACKRCKKRHLKCDETRPGCQRCANAGVECPGYVQTRKFIDQGASVRRRYAPYQESGSRSAGQNLGSASGGHSATPGSAPDQSAPASTSAAYGSAYPAVPSPAENPVGGARNFQVPSPANGAEAASTEPMHREPMHRMQVQGATEWPVVGSTALDRARSVPDRSIRSSPATPMTAAEGVGFSGGAYNDLRHKPFSPHGQTSSGSPSQRSEKEFQDIFSELMTGTEHEVAFLTRHFSEIVGPWLDLSDSKKFFGAYVPVRAIGDEYLKYSMAALAAKHLGRMKGAKLSAVSGMFTSPSTMESYPNSSQVDWFLKAANYYYLAASSMGSAISDAYATMSSSDILASPVEIVKQWLNRHLKNSDLINRADETVVSAFWRKTENLLAASAILTMYKLLDEPGESWQSYLSEIRPVFDALLQLHSAFSDSPPAFSQGATAAFWNFARLDYLASYYTRSQTYLDHQNLTLWRAAGLPIDNEGNLTNPPPHSSPLSQEDLAANSLIWLLNKVVNFRSESKTAPWDQMAQFSPDPSTPSTSSSPRSPPTTASWLKLSFEFQSWFERVPETFRPCLRIEHPRDIARLPDIAHMPFPEIFYCLTTCASTVQQYHFGRLALALNRPADAVSAPSTVFDKLQSYRELMKEADYRCREICGIALARPQSAARVYMIPLLYAVGQCMENEEERRIIVDLLRGIEADLGWVTGTQVRELESFWASR
ncbi:C6 finger domain protein [Aspergillus terreus]|uniref:C6 finger domain protein n=1 Tax=Aspergillus terreus TaxID=33178 RepID=A0A5M3YZG5_ASPTE|nr:hypothetical protein ATETN484_0005068500 [Aspergillus terreus]GFF17337.1 C6 finger domain protein [Aspergillus terreus]